MSLEALFASIAGRDDDKSAPEKTSPDALCITLGQIAERYNRACPFKRGDLVTPIAASDVHGRGEPHVVLEVIERPDPDFAASEPRHTTSNAYGARRDVRVACEVRAGRVATFWLESWLLDPYAPLGAAGEQAPTSSDAAAASLEPAA